MFIPVICPTCGYPLNHVAEIWLKLKKEHDIKIFKSRSIFLDMSSSITDINLEYASILDSLKINNDCCRMAIISTVDMREILHG